MEQMNQAYKVFTRICLNNWHYIDRKVLGLNESINFFTGHSGSGKSTVIDAMQIVLTWRQRPTRSIVYFSGTREN